MSSDEEVFRTDYKFTWYTEFQNYLPELKELISHPELASFNPTAYEHQPKMFKDEESNFNLLSEERKISIVRQLMNQLEMTDYNLRMTAIRCTLFIAQGCVDGLTMLQKNNPYAAENSMLLFRLGIFPLLIDLLNLERKSEVYNKEPVSGEDSYLDYYYLYIILNILYLIIEHMLIEKKSTKQKYKKLLEEFIQDVICCEESDSLLFILFDMMAAFSLVKKPGYPIKKILLLIWKIIMVALGDLKDLSKEKRRKRLLVGLNLNHTTDLDISEGKYTSSQLHKVSTKDLQEYVDSLYLKYPPIDENVALEGIDSLKKHLYIPLSEIQMRYKNFPRNEKVETLYENMLPNMVLYTHCLLQIFQSCNDSPICNKYADYDEEPSCIFGEVCFSYPPENSLDKLFIREHVEIMNKAITGILLLLMKHFKLNHILQFELFCESMMSGNALPYMARYIERTCDVFGKVIKRGAVAEKDFEKFPICKPSPRNLLTIVNVLRIVNKLIKRKHSRTESFLDLTPKYLYSLALLNNNHLSIYCLKILKLISKRMGRKWRQENIKIMNSIFQKVRHRLLDDWNTGTSNNNDDEDILKEQLILFNKQYLRDEEEEEVAENSNASVLPQEFKQNYELWLEEEVFRNPFDWDSLMSNLDWL